MQPFDTNMSNWKTDDAASMMVCVGDAASAMRNLAEVAAYFAARGRAADARRMSAPSEACAGVTTIERAVWRALRVNSSDFGMVVDENAQRARC